MIVEFVAKLADTTGTAINTSQAANVVNNANPAKGVGQLIVVIILFLIVLVATYFVTRWIGGYQKKKTANGNLQVVEAVSLGASKYIELVRVGKDKYIVVGVGKNEINLLSDDIESTDLVADSSQIAPVGQMKKSFSDILSGFKNSLPEKKK